MLGVACMKGLVTSLSNVFYISDTLTFSPQNILILTLDICFCYVRFLSVFFFVCLFAVVVQ
jgi:hypothetical protein